MAKLYIPFIALSSFIIAAVINSNSTKWSEVWFFFKTVGVLPLITMDLRFHLFRFCKVREGCSAALATQENCLYMKSTITWPVKRDE